MQKRNLTRQKRGAKKNTEKVKISTKFSLDRINSRIKEIRSVAVSVTVTLGLCVLTHAIYKEATKKYILLEPIEVPNELTNKGYSSLVIARKLIDEINTIKLTGDRFMRHSINLNNDNTSFGISKNIPELDFEIPETGVSFAAINFFRTYFDNHPRIVSGEILLDRNRFKFTSRFEHDIINYSASIDSLSTGFHYMALELLKIIQPLSAANYLYTMNEHARLKIFVQKNISYMSSNEKSELYRILGLVSTLTNPTEANQYFCMSIENNKYNPNSYISLGAFKEEEGELKEATMLFQQALRLNPKFANAYLNLGVIKEEQGNFKSASIFYKKALEIDPLLPNAYNSLGRLKEMEGEIKTATAFYAKAVAVDSMYANGYCNLGRLMEGQNNSKAAVTFYEKALVADPSFAPACLNLAALNEEKGNCEMADKLYKRALEINPAYINNFLDLATNKEEKTSRTKSNLFFNRGSRGAYLISRQGRKRHLRKCLSY